MILIGQQCQGRWFPLQKAYSDHQFDSHAVTTGEDHYLLKTETVSQTLTSRQEVASNGAHVLLKMGSTILS